MAPRLRKSKGPSETAIQSASIELLEANGFRAERINCGRSRGFNGGILHHARTGTPDTLIVSPYGWIEFKRPGEEPTAEQLNWHAWAAANGVPCTVAHSPEEALAFAEGLRRET